MDIEAVDLNAPLYGFRRFLARQGSASFHVVGVWTADTDEPTTAYRQAIEGLSAHADWIRQRPTVILGDFNDNGSWPGGTWQQLVELTEPLGLVSAYHTFFGEAFGAETRPTYYHNRKESAPAHLDYCFLPLVWVPHITSVEVGGSEPWHTVSDHRRLIVDVELPDRP